MKKTLDDNLPNINEVSSEIETEFRRFVLSSQKLNIYLSPDYREGFIDGVKSLNMAFLTRKPKITDANEG